MYWGQVDSEGVRLLNIAGGVGTRSERQDGTSAMQDARQRHAPYSHDSRARERARQTYRVQTLVFTREADASRGSLLGLSTPRAATPIAAMVAAGVGKTQRLRTGREKGQGCPGTAPCLRPHLERPDPRRFGSLRDRTSVVGPSAPHLFELTYRRANRVSVGVREAVIWPGDSR
jgi:hypothetical protein